MDGVASIGSHCMLKLQPPSTSECDRAFKMWLRYNHVITVGLHPICLSMKLERGNLNIYEGVMAWTHTPMYTYVHTLTCTQIHTSIHRKISRVYIERTTRGHQQVQEWDSRETKPDTFTFSFSFPKQGKEINDFLIFMILFLRGNVVVGNASFTQHQPTRFYKHTFLSVLFYCHSLYTVMGFIMTASNACICTLIMFPTPINTQRET